MLKFKSDIVSFRKQDNINAELYHQKYTWFLMSLNKLGKEEEYNFNDLDDIELEFEDKENHSKHRYRISKVDLAYFQAKNYIKLREDELENVDILYVKLQADGVIFVTEEKDFTIFAKKKLEEEKYAYEAYRSSIITKWVLILTFVISIMFSLGDKDNLLSKEIRKIFKNTASSTKK